MKRSLKDLVGFDIETHDGLKARIKDILFDEENWIIKYLDADFGGLFESRRILIPRVLFKDSHLSAGTFFTELTKDDIDKCPQPEDELTISKRYEEELNKYYNVDEYWAYNYPGTMGLYSLPRPIKVPGFHVDEKQLGTTLRNFNEVKGYEIHAVDGKLGHINDMYTDDEHWQIVYVVVDTSNWLPWSKKIILPVDQIKEISYEKREARAGLSTETIKNAPEFDPEQPIDIRYESVLHEFYTKDSDPM